MFSVCGEVKNRYLVYRYLHNMSTMMKIENVLRKYEIFSRKKEFNEIFIGFSLKIESIRKNAGS